MDDDAAAHSAVRRMSTRSRKVATKMAAALASTDNRTQTALARLEALENDNAAVERVEIIDDDDASLDDEDEGYIQKKHLKGTKRKTRQAEALERKKAPKAFMELLHDANLEALPSHVPSHLKAAVGPPSSSSSRHFCSVCGFSANYTCVRCGTRFCSCRCQIWNDPIPYNLTVLGKRFMVDQDGSPTSGLAVGKQVYVLQPSLHKAMARRL